MVKVVLDNCLVYSLCVICCGELCLIGKVLGIVLVVNLLLKLVW